VPGTPRREARDQRPRELDEGHERGDRVSRQADEGGATHDAHRHGPARLDADPPERQRARRLDGRLDVVLLARGHAAGGDQQVVPGGGGREGA
jgi:hypothetical protein